MIKNSKNKILQDVVIILHLLVRKIKKLKFGHVLQKVQGKCKTAITFAYDVGKKRIIYSKIQHENPHPILTAYSMFAIF